MSLIVQAKKSCVPPHDPLLEGRPLLVTAAKELNLQLYIIRNSYSAYLACTQALTRLGAYPWSIGF